ncbi:contactin-1a-like, partial [Sinocyclocheilus anshuiensis]|uniref:contactin-1a-like n=1 Tax=Sinocyclocheilus anshuiensis TaxID=1608454 RepID=UPI0007B9A5EC
MTKCECKVIVIITVIADGVNRCLVYFASVLIEMIVGQAGTSSSEMLISNTQLRHAGRYSCTAQTPVDNVTVSAELVVRGPPGPPGGVRVDEVMTSSVR